MSLRNAPGATRVFALMVLLVLGLGYALAMVYLFTKEVRPHLEQGHGLVEGVAYTYNGVPTATPKLLVVLQGSMASTVSPSEFRAIEAWVQGGATEQDYAGPVQNIIERNCASCHSASGYPPTITNYAETLPLTEPDSGVDLAKLARMTHIHLLGIPMLLFIMGSLFVRTRYWEWFKALVILLAFGGVVFDVAHWWITKIDARAALGVIVGGAMLGAGFGLMWLLTFLDLWMPHTDPKSGASPTGGEPPSIA